MAEHRIKGPVTLLSPSLINQSGVRIVLSQPLGAAHVRMQGRGALVKRSQSVSAVDCSSVSTTKPMTGAQGGGGVDHQP